MHRENLSFGLNFVHIIISFISQFLQRQEIIKNRTCCFTFQLLKVTYQKLENNVLLYPHRRRKLLGTNFGVSNTPRELLSGCPAEAAQREG